jgi:hypothetical protein
MITRCGQIWKQLFCLSGGRRSVLGRRGTIRIEYEDFSDDELSVKPVRYGEQKQSYNY